MGCSGFKPSPAPLNDLKKVLSHSVDVPYSGKISWKNILQFHAQTNILRY